MIIKLDKLPPEKSQEFLNYLNAGLRKNAKYPFPCGTIASFNAKGEHEAYLEGDLGLEKEKTIRIIWKVVQKPDGSIPFIEATPQIENIEETVWKPLVNTFIQEIMVSTLAEEKSSFFRRSYICHIGPTLDGEYWLPGFRFAPLMPDDEMLSLFGAERMFVIDQEVSALDDYHAEIVAKEQAKIISAQLSLILDIGLYEIQHEYRWVKYQTDDESELKSGRFQLGYWDDKRPEKMPNKEELCKLGRYEDSITVIKKVNRYNIACPKEIRRILRGLSNSSLKIQKAFNRGAGLYQIGLTAGRNMPSIKLAYKVGTIDAIGQNLGLKDAKEFIEKYMPEISKKYIDYIWGNIRSAHWHGGEFPMGEDSPNNLELTNPNHIVIFEAQNQVNKIVRQAIVNWIIDEVAESESPQ